MSTVLLSLCRAHTHSVLAFCKHAERTLSSTSRSEGACVSLKTCVCVHVCECVCVPVGAIEVLCFIYFEHMLSKYQASRAKGWLFQQLCDVNSSRHRYRTKCATVKHSRPIGDRCTATRGTRRTCLRNKQGSSRVRRPNLRSLSNPDL